MGSKRANLVVLLGISLTGCTALLDFSGSVGDTDSGTQQPADAGRSADAAIECGDGLLQTPEECDDDNLLALDGCSPDCRVEAGYICQETPSNCNPVPACPSLAIVEAENALDSCQSYYEQGYRASGRYFIDVDGAAPRAPFEVLCDMKTGGGGWTVLVNNANDQVEPDGCLPRFATVDSFVCGIPSCGADFAVPAFGISFTELVWAVHDEQFAVGSHNLFRWPTPQSLPNSERWSLVAGQAGLRLQGLDTQTLIAGARADTPSGLRRIANEQAGMAGGGFSVDSVITIFDQDEDSNTGGNMSFTDTSSVGLDDFQAGKGCGDLWAPKEDRGAATLVMVR